MLEFFSNVVVQHGLVGLGYGVLGGLLAVSRLWFERGNAKVVIVRVIQGAVTGHVAALAHYSMFQAFSNPTLTVSGVIGFSAGLIGLGFARAIADKIADKMGLDLTKAEKSLAASQKSLARIAESEKKAAQAKQTRSQSDLDKVEEELKNNLRDVQKRLHELENKKG